jgi:tRNA pseudouridine13 synthase
MESGSSPTSGPCWAPGYGHRTHATPPIGFRFRQSPEDFVVEELRHSEPETEGTHVWFEIEKRNLSTVEATRRLGKALERKDSEFGFAGRKDSKAVTRQWMSLEHVEASAIEALEIPGLRVLRSRSHNHKLRVGQLIGNRFRLVLRDVSPAGFEEMQASLATLAESGLPNYYGAQRFGRHGLTYRLGRAYVKGDYREYLLALASAEHSASSPALDELQQTIAHGTKADQRRLARLVPDLDSDLSQVARQLSRRPLDLGRAARAIPKRSRQFHISALQSRVFNRVLSGRISDLECVRAGDVVFVHAKGAAFLADDVAELAPRAAAFEVSPSGPIPGTGTLLAGGAQAELEAAALAAEGLATEDFGKIGFGLDQRGARRPLRVPVTEVDLSFAGGVATLGFALPKGCYATSVLEELRKDHIGG